MESKQQIATISKKRKEHKIASLYSRSVITKKITIQFHNVGSNLSETLEEIIKSSIEGKCIVEGYVKPDSTRIITYSAGMLSSNDVQFDVVFECYICFPVEGMLLNCTVKNVNKAGIKAESSDNTPTPVVVFVARDHSYSNSLFAELKEGDKFVARVIGQRFELNDPNISIIADVVNQPQKEKPVKLIIQD